MRWSLWICYWGGFRHRLLFFESSFVQNLTVVSRAGLQKSWTKQSNNHRQKCSYVGAKCSWMCVLRLNLQKDSEYSPVWSSEEKKTAFPTNQREQSCYVLALTRWRIAGNQRHLRSRIKESQRPKAHFLTLLRCQLAMLTPPGIKHQPHLCRQPYIVLFIHASLLLLPQQQRGAQI